MITYQVALESVDDRYRASCPAIPGVEHIGDGPDEAIAGLPEKLNSALVRLYLSGEPMPLCQFMERGELSVTPSFHWTGSRQA